MKNLFNVKGALSILLVFSVLLGTQGLLFANVVNETSINDDSVIEQTDVVDGDTYYFKDTSKFTINAIYKKTGDVEISFKDKKTGEIKLYIGKNDRCSGVEDIKTFSEVNDFNADFNSMELIQSYHVNDFESENSSRAEASLDESNVVQKIDKCLESLYGGSYYNKFIKGLYHEKTYEDMPFIIMKRVINFFMLVLLFCDAPMSSLSIS